MYATWCVFPDFHPVVVPVRANILMEAQCSCMIRLPPHGFQVHSERRFLCYFLKVVATDPGLCNKRKKKIILLIRVIFHISELNHLVHNFFFLQRLAFKDDSLSIQRLKHSFILTFWAETKLFIDDCPLTIANFIDWLGSK